MRQLKKLIIFPILFFSPGVFGQFQYSLGYTGAWFYSNRSISGGFAYAISRNFDVRDNSSFSVSTNLKLGIEDKVGGGLIIPALAAWVAGGKNHNNYNNIKNISASINDMNGGKVNLFLDVPLLFHFNYGLGSGIDCPKQAGFYIGGGFSYIRTGYTDLEGFSKSTGFMGCVADAGVRFMQKIDVNFSNVFALGQQVGPMKSPVFSEITVALILGYGRR